MCPVVSNVVAVENLELYQVIIQKWYTLVPLLYNVNIKSYVIYGMVSFAPSLSDL